MPTINKVLVANRGEIAIRVMRTARAMGLETVAVYSEADAGASFVRMADEAHLIGPSPVSESYLNVAAIIDAARASGADAVHPGYGFLSENAAFAAACADAGLIFIGPPIRAIEVMGDKARAKRAMIDAGVPCVPGYQGEDQSDARLVRAAEEIGFPVMVKAAAGGGGRGMRLVTTPADLPGALSLARSEAKNAFGADELIIEKAISRPRHVEIQVFADAHGHAIHLGERDCSVQRRHQKVVEEAPCPVMTPTLREAMGTAAVNAARAVDYRGAGTVEFLLDADGAFYFLEMNTRLQVEHPVTEEVTGLDLVALQIRVAQGEHLDLAQSDVRIEGHAIEVRLYAEDPAADFLPSTGPIDLWRAPAGEGIRVDAGIASGGEVSPFYDPMVAKIIAYGRTRDEARRRLIAALGATALFGPTTNRDFLIDVLGQPAFAQGRATTAFIAETYGAEGFAPPAITFDDAALAIAVQQARLLRQARARSVFVPDELVGWSSTADLRASARYQIGDATEEVIVRQDGDALEIEAGDRVARVTLERLEDEVAWVESAGRRSALSYVEGALGLIRAATDRVSFAVRHLSATIQDIEDAAGGGRVTAPMHGKLLSISVKTGDSVKKGDALAVLEAMKMQHEIVAEVDGTVTEVLATPDEQLSAGAMILEIAPTADSS